MAGMSSGIKVLTLTLPVGIRVKKPVGVVMTSLPVNRKNIVKVIKLNMNTNVIAMGTSPGSR